MVARRVTLECTAALCKAAPYVRMMRRTWVCVSLVGYTSVDIIDGIEMSCQGNTAYVDENAIVVVTTVSARGAILTAATYRMQPASVFTM